jgi:hypothetical protein
MAHLRMKYVAGKRRQLLIIVQQSVIVGLITKVVQLSSK